MQILILVFARSAVVLPNPSSTVPLRRDRDSVRRDIQLHLAAQYGYTEAVKSLLEEDKTDVDQPKILVGLRHYKWQQNMAMRK